MGLVSQIGFQGSLGEKADIVDHGLAGKIKSASEQQRSWWQASRRSLLTPIPSTLGVTRGLALIIPARPASYENIEGVFSMPGTRKTTS